MIETMAAETDDNTVYDDTACRCRMVLAELGDEHRSVLDGIARIDDADARWDAGEDFLWDNLHLLDALGPSDINTLTTCLHCLHIPLADLEMALIALEMALAPRAVA